MAVSWHDTEDPTQRRTEEIRIGRRHSFVFSALPISTRLTAMPVRGDDLSSITKLGVAGMTGFGTRVVSSQVVQRKGKSELHVVAVEPQPYTAGTGGPELQGSRGEPSQDRLWRLGEMMFISTDGSTGIPAIGTTYFTTPAGTTESGLHGRICKSVVDDWDMVPGLCITTVTFIGAEAYPSATPEIKGSRVSSKNDLWRLGTMKYVSTDGTTGVAVPGTTYYTTPAGVTESGLTGRRCKNVSQDWDTVPGLCITTASFIGAEPYVAGQDGPEIKGSRRERRNKDGNNAGEMLFLSTTTTAGVPVPGGTYFTNMDGAVEGGLQGRICDYLGQDKDTVPGVVFTRAHFKTAGATDFRQPNVARVSIRGLTSQEEMTYDRDGKCIQGPYFEHDFQPSRYRVTKGDVSSLKKKAIIVIETAYASLNPGEVLGYIDTVNSQALSKLGLAKETCRMLAPDATRWWRQGSLWYVNYAMLFDPKAGHNKVEVIRETRMPFKMPLLDEKGAVIANKFRTVYDWINKTRRIAGNAITATEKEDRAPYELRSWSDLDGMITWD